MRMCSKPTLVHCIYLYVYILVIRKLLCLHSLSHTHVHAHTHRLLAHVFDPELDQAHPREFVVYACPQGALGRQMEDFMETTLYRSGRNGAHKSFPHVTLCQLFMVHTLLSHTHTHIAPPPPPPPHTHTHTRPFLPLCTPEIHFLLAMTEAQA